MLLHVARKVVLLPVGVRARTATARARVFRKLVRQEIITAALQVITAMVPEYVPKICRKANHVLRAAILTSNAIQEIVGVAEHLSVVMLDTGVATLTTIAFQDTRVFRMIA